MTDVQDNPQTQNNDREINFRAQEKALKDHYERQLHNERQARLEAERIAQESQKRLPVEEDDDDSEPYVDHKKLKKSQDKVKTEIRKETQSDIQKAVSTALHEERKQNWIKQNPDFYDMLQQHADKIHAKDPDLAESILEMPETFERQKLVYKTIKTMGLHKPEEKKSSIQDKIEANKRGQYYQPTNIGTAPYQGQTADFSHSGQKAAYEKMKSLISNVRI